MCRYQWKHYNAHRACFKCRIALKNVPICPHCKCDMENMGLDFKAPPKRDKKAWKAVEAMTALGMRFESCGCGGPGYTCPRTANGVTRMHGTIDRKLMRKLSPEVLKILGLQKHLVPL